MSWSGYTPADTEEPADDNVWGRDESKLIGVALTPEGDLHDLSIATEWRGKIDAKFLGAAVFSAYNTAESARLTQERTHPRAQESGAEGATGEIPDIPASLLLDVSREQGDYVATYDESLRRVQELVSNDGNVTVSAVGGSVGTISFDQTWLKFAAGRDIAATARPLLAQAIRSGKEIDSQMRMQFPAITEFRRLRALKKAARRH